MTSRLLKILACTTLLFTTAACQLLANPTRDSGMPQQVVEPTIRPMATATENSAATRDAEKYLAQATQDAEFILATQAVATAESAKTAQQAAITATAGVQLTNTAQDLSQQIENLRSQGIIQRSGGRYYPVGDFNESWAQLGWYQWWNTGYSPTSFVISAHTSWETASSSADWYNAGCGFVFHAKDEKNHLMIYLALDGNVYMKGYMDDHFHELGRGYYGRVDHLKGAADVTLAVDGPKITYLVNGEKVFQRENNDLTSGNLALTLVSGTNKDYGMRCTMTGIALWDLDQQ